MSTVSFRALLLAVVMAAGAGFSVGLRFDAPYLEGFHPLDEEPASTFSPLNARKPVVLKLESKMFHDTSQIDFEKRQITFRRTDPLGYTLWEYHYGELSDYLSSRRSFSVARTWQDNMAILRPSGIDASRQGLKFEWEWSVQYPSWAQRVLGKEPPKLTIDGYLEIKMGYANTQYDNEVPTDQIKTNNDFNFDIDYQFTITGSVGRLIHLNITASKNQNFDISNDLKNMKIEYKESTPGELEDEIVQEVIVGYTGFSMPGTNLSGYSESKEGLFGIKVRSRLGPLELTTIASIEQGQSNKKTYSSSGSGSGGTVTFNSDDYIRDKYFFLDNIYRRHYIRKYNISNPVANPDPVPRITELSVWRSFDGVTTGKLSHIKNVRLDSTETIYKFERLERDLHYYVDNVEGYIRLDTVYLQQKQQIAIYMRTEKADDPRFARLQKGSMTDTARSDGSGIDTVWTLWVLRPAEQIRNAADDTSRYYLPWRNVYGPANFSDPASFQLSVKLNRDNIDTLEQGPDGKTFLADIMGLATENKPLISNEMIFNRKNSELILPPFDTAWEVNTVTDGLEPFSNPALGEYRDSVFYRYSDDEVKFKKSNGEFKPHYFIEMSGSKKRTTFDDLGWGIMPGTERVKADGAVLERDIDYSISYDMGSVDLISPRAKAAKDIEIEYQSEALFVPERKMFLGAHGRVELPFITDKSYAGASILFQSTESNDDIPRLDQEPYNKMLFDINTHIEFEPEWLTKLANMLPLVHTQTPSSVALDLEFAHSRVNPNKAKSAYIDDFEESKQADQLSNHYLSWYVASPPYLGDSLWTHPPAWDCYWFSPREQDYAHSIKRDEILVLTEAEQKAGATGSNTESVLRLHVTPAPNQDTLLPRFKNAWAGIMTPISQSFANKKQSQFFEFFVKADNGFAGKGKLLLQMGVMREDISLNGGPPNNRPDREDTAQIIQTQTYDKNLDLGWDKLHDSSEVYVIPGAQPGQWDTLRYGDRLLGPDSLDPARDNFRQYYYKEGDVNNFRYACRRQLDGKIELSEDINFDGTVQTSTVERYYQYEVDLSDDASPWIDRSVNYANPGLWRKYRIPLREKTPGYEDLCDSVNDPNWSNITMVRLIWTGFDSTGRSPTTEQSLVFYNMEFVGNQWIESTDSSRVKIRSSVVNTKEDKNYEDALSPLINRERDEYGYEVEQSLRLNFVNLVPGDTALVVKSFQYQTLNLSAYEQLSLLVYGKDPVEGPDGRVLFGENVRFVFRFGSDDSTYYEYSSPIRSGWNNIISINLKELSALKDDFMVANRDSAIDVSRGKLRVHATKGRQPNFSRVQWMALGVIRDFGSGGSDSLSGELWIDEMKLTGIRKIIGSASRVDFSTKMADLISMQARMEYENGNFRRMTETENLPDNTQLSGSMGASIGLEKFLPQEWGLSLQTGVTFNSSISRPQLKNQTDVYLVNDKGNPDGFMDVIKDAATDMVGIEQTGNHETDAELYQTGNVGRTYYTGYRKTGRDENPLVSFLADRWDADARYSTTIAEVRYGRNAAGDTLFAKRDTTDIYSGKVHYDLSPRDPPEWLKWSPFKGMKQEWFPDRIKDYEFTPLPRNFQIDVADINFQKQRQTDTWRRLPFWQQNRYTVRHNLSIDYTPISPLLDMEYSVGVNRDLIDAASDETIDKGKKIFKRDETWDKYMVLWGEKDRTQHVGINFSPRFFEWLTTSAGYTSDYNQTVVQYLKEPDPYLNAGVKSNVSLNGSISFDQLLGDLKTAAGKNALASVVESIKKGFDAIGLRQISANYTAASTLTNNYISTGLLGRQHMGGIKDFLLYQAGIKGRTPLDLLAGEMDDDRFLGMRSRDTTTDRYADFYRNDSRVVDRSIRLSSGFEIKPLDLSFRQIGFNHSITYSVYPDSTRSDTTITYPDFSVSLSSQILNRVDLVKNNLQGLSLNSSFTYRQSDRLTAAQIGGSSRSLKYDLLPLASLTGTLKKWPVRFDYRHNFSRERSMSLTEDRKEDKLNKNATMHENTFSLNYDIERNSKLTEIKLLTWTIPVKGRTSLGMTLNHRSEEDKVPGSLTKSFEWIPKISYVFTDNVNGRLEFTYRKSENRGKTTNTIDFSIIIRISL